MTWDIAAKVQIEALLMNHFRITTSDGVTFQAHTYGHDLQSHQTLHELLDRKLTEYGNGKSFEPRPEDEMFPSDGEMMTIKSESPYIVFTPRGLKVLIQEKIKHPALLNVADKSQTR